MIRHSLQNSGFAGTATAHRTGKTDVDACIEQRGQNGLTWGNGYAAAAAIKSHLKPTN